MTADTMTATANKPLIALYDKDELDDLSPKEKSALKTLLKQELEERK